MPVTYYHTIKKIKTTIAASAASEEVIASTVQDYLTENPPSSADNTAYDASSWNNSMVAATKNAIRDKIETMISDAEYDETWDGITTVAPSKNAVYDKFESLSSGGLTQAQVLTRML